MVGKGKPPYTVAAIIAMEPIINDCSDTFAFQHILLYTVYL